MLRNFNVGCVVAQRNAPSTIQGALAYGITHPTTEFVLDLIAILCEAAHYFDPSQPNSLLGGAGGEVLSIHLLQELVYYKSNKYPENVAFACKWGILR